MILLKTILNRRLNSILRPPKPSNYPPNPHCLTSLIHSNLSKFSFPSLFSYKPFSLSSYSAENSEEKRQQESNTQSSVLFEETVNGPSKNVQSFKVEGERHEKGKTLKPKSDGRLQKGVKRSLSEIFSDKGVKKVEKLVEPFEFADEGSIVHNKLSSDVQMLAYHLYNKGYFKDQTFIPKDRFDLNCFERTDCREYLKSAAMKFGRDHQKIARWLSPGDLKAIALFGCPSLIQRSIYATKRLRRFFEIEEHQVCKMCPWKKSCRHTNKLRNSDKVGTKLWLDDVTRVLLVYAMDVEPREGVIIPDEIKNCVSRLLKQIIKLSQSVS